MAGLALDIRPVRDLMSRQPAGYLQACGTYFRYMEMQEPVAAGALPERVSSLEKALDLCEALSGAERGFTLSELARAVRLPAPTAHRLLRLLKRRGFVRQDEESGRYALTLKMLDLSFRLLGRSELRLHAYPVVREFVLRTGARAFVAVPASGEVTYLWTTGPDAVAMHTTYGREMPGHCAMYFGEGVGTRRLSCLELGAARRSSSAPGATVRPRDGTGGGERAIRIVRFGAAPDSGVTRRLNCTCAPILDYSGREVGRVGLFGHGPDESRLADDGRKVAEVARAISLRLGYLPTAAVAVTA
jgi:IclR family acetate operon transcriptional repressor